jgi:outer membrane protein TolC
MILFFIPLAPRAQEAPRPFSLREAISFALDHNKQLRVSGMNVDVYRQRVREAISQGLPQVAGTVNYATNFNHEMSFGDAMKMTMEDQSSATLSLQQLIFSGQWIVGIQASKIARQLAEQQVELTGQEIVENVCNSYHAILVSERMLEIVDRNIEHMNELYNHTRDLFAAGVTEETDVDQIRVNVSQLKNTRLSMQRTLEVTYNLLRVQMGLENGAPLLLGDKLDGLLDPGESARLALQPFDIESNLQFRILETQAEVGKKKLELEKWSFAPTLAGSYSYTYKILKPPVDMSPNHSAGVNLSIPIFSGLQRKSKVAQARIELDQTLVNRSLLQDQLTLQDNQLKFELNNALENYNLQQENIAVAGRVLESYKRKYALGAVSSLELTQANTSYLQAESNYTNALLSLLQARLNLEKLHNLLPYQ